MAACTRGARARIIAQRASPQVQAVTTGLPCAVVLRLIRDLRGEPCRLPPSPAAMPLALPPAWRVHGRARTTRFRRPRRCRSSTGKSASTAPRPTFVTTRTSLFNRGGMAAIKYRFSESQIFFAGHLEPSDQPDSARQISICAHAMTHNRVQARRLPPRTKLAGRQGDLPVVRASTHAAAATRPASGPASSCH